MANAVGTNCIATGERNEIRMILLGRTGTGKSSLGNTILDRDVFVTDFNPNPITTRCTCGAGEHDGKRLFVVDTPGFLDPNIESEEIQREVAKSYQMTAFPGPHAFLLVIEPTKFTDQEVQAIAYLDKIFGPQAVHHTILIFTHADEVARRGSSIEQYLGKLKTDSPLKRLINQCGNRYLSVNNMGTREEKQMTIETLINKIEVMIAYSDGQVYRNNAFDDVAKFIFEEKCKGTFKPYSSDGIYMLLPQTEEIVIGGFLRRTDGRRNAS